MFVFDWALWGCLPTCRLDYLCLESRRDNVTVFNLIVRVRVRFAMHYAAHSFIWYISIEHFPHSLCFPFPLTCQSILIYINCLPAPTPCLPIKQYLILLYLPMAHLHCLKPTFMLKLLFTIAIRKIDFYLFLIHTPSPPTFLLNFIYSSFPSITFFIPHSKSTLAACDFKHVCEIIRFFSFFL